MSDEPFDPSKALAAEGIAIPQPIEVDPTPAISLEMDRNGHVKGVMLGDNRTIIDFDGDHVELTPVSGDAFTLEADRFSVGGKPGVNPKDALGAQKPDPSVVPPCAELHLATAMMDGAVKYGPFNWRDNPVQARIYYAAARRHLAQWLDGEDFDPTSSVHHLGHAMACCAILLDAYEQGNLVDDRPMAGMSGSLIRQFTPESKFSRIGRTIQRWLGR